MALGANALYDKGREGFLDGSIDWDTDPIKAVLVTSGYTMNSTNIGTHQFLSDISSGNRVATSGVLTNKTKTNGVADADDTVFTAVSGSQVVGIALYKDLTGADTVKRLIAWIEVATGLPVTPSGSDITVIWDNGANRIFKL